MSNYNLKLITTQDGSHSLLREDLNETYHSFHGARGESMHVFINQGLAYLLDSAHRTRFHMLEIGFGTGLNALLTAAFAEQYKVHATYHTLEPIPVPELLYAQLNYGENEMEKKVLLNLHQAPWEKRIGISKWFDLQKFKTPLEQFTSDSLYDIVFFDAFAPSKQAEIWSLENLKKCYRMLQMGGILVTYCAQGQFKRNLASAGFDVQTLPGAMGKKEMVRGIKVPGAEM